MLVLHPSPEELIASLDDDELIALDLLLERLPNGDVDRRAKMDDPAVADLGSADQSRLQGLVPDPIRRGRVVTVARQLRRLGIEIRPRREGTS